MTNFKNLSFDERKGMAKVKESLLGVKAELLTLSETNQECITAGHFKKVDSWVATRLAEVEEFFEEVEKSEAELNARLGEEKTRGYGVFDELFEKIVGIGEKALLSNAKDSFKDGSETFETKEERKFIQEESFSVEEAASDLIKILKIYEADEVLDKLGNWFASLQEGDKETNARAFGHVLSRVAEKLFQDGNKLLQAKMLKIFKGFVDTEEIGDNTSTLKLVVSVWAKQSTLFSNVKKVIDTSKKEWSDEELLKAGVSR